jgi:hypothetical protein
MLFDLRGRGRRRFVQGIYLALALLMGGGLVFFGVGGNTSGGLLDAFKNDSGNQTTPAYSKQIKAEEKRVKVNPKDVAAWATLTKLRFQDASAVGYDSNTQSFTDKGKDRLAEVEDAWNHYVALKPKKVDPTLALFMVQTFSPQALGKPDDAVSAMEYVLAARKPTAALYIQYAQLAYAAGQSRKGELAAQKAISLAPKDQRAALQATLDQLKQQAQSQTSTTPTVANNPVQAAPEQSAGNSTIVTSSTKNGKVITKTTKNGKTTTSVKPAPKSGK